MPYPVVMTIAGSDSGGGAGIQADLKTFAGLDTFGTTAITCVTAQNPDGVFAVQAISPEIVARQIRAIGEAFPVAAGKTGMLYSREIIEAVAHALADIEPFVLVVDPVMIATSGGKLLQDEAITALREKLFPLASLLTPNLPEAEALLDREIADEQSMIDAARQLGEETDCACLLKGGHMTGDDVIDILYTEGEITAFRSPRIIAVETHGTGCTLAAALTAYLAHGRGLVEAVNLARTYVASSLENAITVGDHFPLGWTF